MNIDYVHEICLLTDKSDLNGIKSFIERHNLQKKDIMEKHDYWVQHYIVHVNMIV